MISPFFIGLVADRYFATEKVMAVLYAIGAVLMYLVTRATTFPQVYCLMLAFCLCYFPTVALTNSIGFQLVKDPGREFPVIRLMGTFGWIFINNIIGFMKWETTTGQFWVNTRRLSRDGGHQLDHAASHAAQSQRHRLQRPHGSRP